MAGIRDRIHAFALPTPFPVGPVNVYLVEGDPLTLVDTGPRTEAAWHDLLAGLSALGYSLNDIEQIVITHAHIDHIGQTRALVEASGARVLGHARNLYWLTDFEVEWVRRQAFYGTYLYQAGMPEDQMAIVREVFSPGVRLGASIPSDHLQFIAPGDVVRTGGGDWIVFHMPGHASGHIALYQPEAGLIVAGDLLLARISSNPVLESPAQGENERPRSLIAYLDSLQRLAELDASLTLTGHGPPVEDHRRLVAERAAMHQQRLVRIVDILEAGRKTAYDVCEEMFPKLVKHDVFLGMSEVIGHLDVLEAEGQVSIQKDGGLLYYTVRS